MISNQLFGNREWQWCSKPELIENYDKAMADTTQTWVCHHRLETHNSDGELRLVPLSLKELKALDMYYQRPPEELIFMARSDHASLHNICNKQWTKLRDAKIGKPLSEETKKKISNTLTGRKNPEHSKRMKGRHWYNNGIISVNRNECPPGFVPGRLK